MMTSMTMKTMVMQKASTFVTKTEENMIEVVDGQRKLSECKRIVVKIGSSLLTANGQGLDLDAISHWAKQIADLHNADTKLFQCLQELWQKVWFV